MFVKRVDSDPTSCATFDASRPESGRESDPRGAAVIGTSAVGLQRAVKPAGGGIHFMRIPPLFRRALGGRRGGRAADPRGGCPPRRRYAGDAAPLGAGRRVCPRTRDWTPAVVAQARIVARLRDARALAQARSARRRESGRLAFGYVEDLLARHRRRRHTLEEAAEGDRSRAGADRAHLRDDRASARASPSSSPRTTSSSCATSPPSWRPASRSSPSCSSSASTGRRSPRSPTPRCASSTSTSTSR